MIVVVMGVSGSGKTTIGRALAERMGWAFFDADDFHPVANIEKMHAGIALTDEDRRPWLDRLAADMGAINARGENAVLACSALKQAYRDSLARAGDVRFVYLKGDQATIAARLGVRSDHYMPASLLASQFAALEEPTKVIVVDIRSSIDAQVDTIIRELRERAPIENAPQPTYRPATNVAHLGRNPKRFLGAVNTPVFRASTILFPTMADMENAARGQYEGVSYGLHGLPTVTDLQSAFAQLEGGHAALAVPSGLTATTMPLLALVRGGDHVLVVDSVYGPTRRFCDSHLPRYGVEVTYYDPLAGAAIEHDFRPNTRIVFTESPGSLTFEVQDIAAIAAVAHARGAKVVLDNTWATPLFFRAFDHGVDVSVHAATKYLGGHSDVLLGLIVGNRATFPLLHRYWTDIGVTASTDDCFLGLRGLRTLAVRLKQHQASALAIAQWLQEQPGVREVIYPALPGARGHALWKRDFTGASGLFSVVLQPVAKERIAAMLDGMRLFRMGWSWGGFESLIIPIYPERIRTVTRWDAGGPCLRLHIGLEDADDLIADLADGLARLHG